MKHKYEYTCPCCDERFLIAADFAHDCCPYCKEVYLSISEAVKLMSELDAERKESK